MTLRTRLAFWFAGLLAITIVFFSIAVFGLMWWSMVRDVDAALFDTANLINNGSLFTNLPVAQPEDFQLQLPELDFVSASGTEVQIWLKEGNSFDRLVYSSANLRDYGNALDPEMLGTGLENVYSTVNIEGSWWRVHTSAIYDGDEVIGSIQVTRSMEGLYDATRSLFAVVLGCALITIVGAVIISRWLAQRLLEPIQDLTSAASRIAGASDLSTRLTWNGPNDELGRLIAVFNRMMERLQDVFRIQQRFVADISHELRTPLTGIIGNVELMRRYGADEDSLNAIHTDTARMSRLVHDLLMLARADSGGTPIHPMKMDADAALSAAVKSATHAAEQKGLSLVLGHIEPLSIMGDPQQIKQLLDNVIDNAIKFTPTGGQITLTMQRVDQSARIEVTDTGVGIAAEHQQRVFDRFYQVDTARAQDGSGGFGLGLSVARWIAEAHHGSIEVRSQPGTGTTFTIHIPLANSFHEATSPSRRLTDLQLPRIRYGDDKPTAKHQRPVTAIHRHTNDTE
jgi:two-component system OmpR family sensor kinase